MEFRELHLEMLIINPIGNMVKEDTEIVQNINHIGEGIHNAVEANMKNERLKTD